MTSSEDSETAPAVPARRRGLGAWWPAVGWAAVIFVLSSIPGSAYPSTNLPGADKLVHITIYGILGFFSARALRLRGSMKTLPLIAATATIAVLFGVTDELHQLF